MVLLLILLSMNMMQKILHQISRKVNFKGPSIYYVKA